MKAQLLKVAMCDQFLGRLLEAVAEESELMCRSNLNTGGLAALVRLFSDRAVLVKLLLPAWPGVSHSRNNRLFLLINDMAVRAKLLLIYHVCFRRLL